MIPWFVVHIIGWLAWPFGREVYVTATSGNWWGADRVHFIERDRSLPRPRKLAPYRGGPLTPALIDGFDSEGAAISYAIADALKHGVLSTVPRTVTTLQAGAHAPTGSERG